MVHRHNAIIILTIIHANIHTLHSVEHSKQIMLQPTVVSRHNNDVFVGQSGEPRGKFPHFRQGAMIREISTMN